MSGQSGGQRVCLAKLNEQLTCKLCGGYFIDATTIIECLHSFCKSCIVKYLESNKYCPICEVQVHKSRPLLNIRPDYTLQDIVYKLVPGCYQNEMRCRKEFYAKHPDECIETVSPESRGEPIESHIYSPDESLSLSLEYSNPCTKDLSETDTEKPILRRYFRCPAAVTIFHLQKLIRAKYGLGDVNRVDIMYEEEPLCSSYSLMDVMYIYHWRRKVPLHLSYRIFETSSKRLKLSEDNANYKKSLIDAGIDSIEIKDEKSLKREWKEVQLKISETGVMSITDISNIVHKKDIDALQEEKISEKTIASIAEVNKAGSVIENCGIPKSVEIMQSTLIIDPELTKNPIFSDPNNAFLVTSDVKFTNENSSTKNCMPLTNNQHNGTDTKQANETRNSTAPAKSQQEAQEVKVHNQTTNVEDKSETVSQGPKAIDQSATQFTEEKVVEIEDKEKIDIHAKKMSINNNNNSADFQTESQKECIKNSSEAKVVSAGSKIDALSAKLQFQPKVGQVNNTYSKKALKEKRTIFQQDTKKPDVKSSTEDTKLTDVKAQTNSENVTNKVSVSMSTPSQKSIVSTVASQNISDSLSVSDKQKALDEKNNQSIDLQQALNLLEQRNSPVLTSSESTPRTSHEASMVSQKLPNNIATMSRDIVSTVPNVSTATISQTASSFPYSLRDIVTNSAVLKSALKNSSSIPQKPLPIACSTSNNQISPMPQFNMQTSPINMYSVPTSLKNNYSNVSQDITTVMAASTATITTTAMSKPISTGSCPIPPCPDAIPISLMKQISMRKQDVTAKGTNLNKICAKIGSNTIGSKINDICAKIGENSKEKNKVDAHSKSEVPDLLRISAKKNLSPLLPNSDAAMKHIPNIPNVPVYTPSSNVATMENKNTKSALPTSTSANVLAVSTSSVLASSHSTQRLAPLKKQNQPIGYKTLRDPPKSWNPTLSKNNYVAAKNQAKEMQNQIQTSMSESTNKQIPSKPAKIFKMRNMPRYLGNPASGVKPMYGIASDTKEKDQLTTNTKCTTLNMMKIDPKTLSPIVSTFNSPIVSPPLYSPNARSYQNTPFSRDICRNTGSPISPRNSPVNMLSTNPFIPSPTPNTNPRIIYSHFPSPFPDASRFPNPLIRSPIGIPPPSAFHSSLPPSINKLYQRSSYIPQTTGYAPVVGQPPTVQRIPPSTHSSSPKSPKASSPSSISSTYNLGKAESQSPVTSTVDNVALLLSKSVTVPVSVPVPVSVSLQRELNAFNLSKTGGLSPSQTSNVVKTSSTMDTNDANVETQLAKLNSSSLNLAITANAEVPENSSPSSSTNERKQGKETEARKVQETARCIEDNSKAKLMEAKCSVEVADNTSSLYDKKEKNQAAKINGDVTIEQFANKKSKEADCNDKKTTTAETTEREGHVERSSPKERNNIPKSNTQTNVNDSLADSTKSENLGKSGEQIQGNKSEVQKNKAET
ncbi:PREDICTED: mucin-17-like [Cyphomyrmex costatus]|uniref:Polycomb complex protein BMI-1 n=1 Tax=Cyphomyrmex costatus TaxID=456900 RepID=A0A195CW96_9HYME|nr:PREDICTED: mucin-17-like [Cyphomyrmex costatus]KYN04429.1 Polycomb complex protein BMI-1 [Cyphomyrmex costatus]